MCCMYDVIQLVLRRVQFSCTSLGAGVHVVALDGSQIFRACFCYSIITLVTAFFSSLLAS